MNSQTESPIESKHLVVLGFLCFVVLLAALILMALSAATYPGVFLFGLLEHGIVELVLLGLFALGFLALAVMGLRQRGQLSTRFTNILKPYKSIFLGLTVAGLLVGWAAVTIPPDFFGRFGSYYQWLRPAAIALGLIALQISGLYLWCTRKYMSVQEPAEIFKSKTLWLVFGLAFLLVAISYITKYGVVAETPLWNVPGVPVSGTQMLLTVIPFAFLLLIYALSPSFRGLLARRTAQFIIIILIYLAAVLVWGFTPLNGDSLAVEPSLANPQPYPQRDARVHDLGALSILWGEGINFTEYTDKPLYMVILAGLHLVTGYDYRLLQLALVALLGVIPVLFYLFGKRFHSSLFGVMLAALVILQQRNAVALSRMISSVNVKLLVTETFVLMGMVLLAFLLLKWEDRNDKRVLLLLGGVVGALSLIRLNPILFFPFIGLLIVIVYWKRKKLLLPRLLIFTLGFLIVFTPWVLSGRNAEGQPYLIVKVRDIFLHRIAPQLNGGVGSHVAVNPEIGVLSAGSRELALQFDTPTGFEPVNLNLAGFINTAALFTGDEVVVSDGGGAQYLKLLANHYIHNIITSILPLPDVLSRSGVRVLAQRDYWDDRMIWDGSLSAGLIRFVIINLALVSLGIAASWRSQRWKGLIPLGLFLAYDLAISISLTSGGRYIVPIIWVFFLYYSLGIVYLLQMLVRFFQPAGAAALQAYENYPRKDNKPRLLPVYIALVLVALLIPVANQLVPLFVTTTPVDRADALFGRLNLTEDSDRHYVNGIVLYPVYLPEKDRVNFDFYQGASIKAVRIDFNSPEETSAAQVKGLTSGEPARLEYNAADELTGTLIIRNGEPVEFWSFADDPDSIP